MNEKIDKLICISSNANLDTFDNSRSIFTNILPYAIQSKLPGQKLYIRVKGIAYGQVFLESQEFAVECLKIHIKELEEQFQDFKYCQVAASIPFTPQSASILQHGTYCFYQLPHCPFLPLKVTDLRELNVRLTDEADFNVDIHDHCPQTHLFIQITNMPDQIEFVITCTSYHPNYFPGNTVNDFRSPLPKEIQLGDFEVTLQNIVRPHHMKEKTSWASMEVRIAPRIEDETFIEESDIIAYIRVDLSSLQSIDDFIEEVNRQIKEVADLQDKLSLEVINVGTSKRIAIRHRADENQPALRIILFDNFSTVCGEAYRPIRKFDLPPQRQYVFKGAPNLFNALASPVVMLECDIIEPNILSGKQARMLACVPMDLNDPEGKRIYKPELHTFQPVSNLPISSIGFTLRDSARNIREYETSNPEDYIMITLLFRQMRK